ncbi:hypothetical protein BDZ85DRAFT_257812 [Elsinoe ampelina]|uniref:F-box domain-containing protein n=1 Tax=Elsinoe ampelina TaxID=302913 RepID=A0A6A6GIQ8_9PEZI|nr:hypothetical protein BDZ85DRAFT_257812 [Elsinoe ampelina]
MAFDLLALPFEIRMMIYQDIAESQRLQYSLHLDAHSEKVWRLEGPDDTVPNLWAIASGCKTTYREALTLLYGSLEIYVFIPDDAYQINFYTSALSRFPSAVSMKDLRCLAIDLPVDNEVVNRLEAFMQLFEFGKHRPTPEIYYGEWYYRRRMRSSPCATSSSIHSL